MQEITTYVIILSAIIYTLYNFYIFLFPKKNKSKNFSCSGACSGCALSKNYKAKITVKSFN